MSSIKVLFDQSQLSLASYGTFQSGTVNFDELLKDTVGMSPNQAASFVSQYTVVDQYTHHETNEYVDGFGETQVIESSNGLSVTVFEEIETGKRASRFLL